MFLAIAEFTPMQTLTHTPLEKLISSVYFIDPFLSTLVIICISFVFWLFGVFFSVFFKKLFYCNENSLLLLVSQFLGTIPTFSCTKDIVSYLRSSQLS